MRISNPWVLSTSLHAFFVLLVMSVLVVRWLPHLESTEIVILETPKISQQAVELAKPQPKIIPKSRQIYGVSRKSITSDVGLETKQGNTIAKTPDQEKLKDTDADSIPIPSEDYLVTQMPQLEQEVFVPYPPGAKERGVSGVVTMDLLIDSRGKVRKVDLVDGPDPELNKAAVQAAGDFKFKPALIQDKPVAVKIRYAYRFVIRG